MSTFNQLENADTDPETIASVLGITYNPKATYSIIIVDTHAPAAGQAVTIVPTYSNLGKMAKSEIKGVDRELVDLVMTKEYSKVYAEAMEAFAAEELDISSAQDLEKFVSNYFDDPEDITRFEERLRIEERYGANQQHYTGDGTTRNLLSSGGECGAMEVLNVDKSPKTVGELIGRGAATRLECTSL